MTRWSRLAALCASSAAAAAWASPWASLNNLENVSSAVFTQMVEPLAQMTKLTYTATQGSYFNETESILTLQNLQLQGWHLQSLEDPPFGMRALFFTHQLTHRAAVAFRGTDLNSTNLSGQADQCADKVLFEMNETSLPHFCDKFNYTTLDYLSAAQNFVASVQQRQLPQGFELLFTGHSLGAGLSMLTAVMGMQSEKKEGKALCTRVVGFSVPGVKDVLENRTGVGSGVLRVSGRAFDLANAFDPVNVDSQKANQSVGNVCLWQPPEPPACSLCYENDEKNKAACASCFAETHVFSHYLELLKEARPTCLGSHIESNNEQR